MAATWIDSDANIIRTTNIPMWIQRRPRCSASRAPAPGGG
jgi:hypothetical protein